MRKATGWFRARPVMGWVVLLLVLTGAATMAQVMRLDDGTTGMKVVRYTQAGAEVSGGDASAANQATANTFLENIADILSDIFSAMSLDATRATAAKDTGPQGMFKAAVDFSSHTAVTDGQTAQALSDILGRALVVGPCDRSARLSGVTTITDGSSTAATGFAAASGIYNEVWDVIIANTSASAVTVDIRSGAAGAVLATLPVPANTAGVVHRLAVPITGAVNTAIAIDPSSAASSIVTTLNGCKAK